MDQHGDCRISVFPQIQEVLVGRTRAGSLREPQTGQSSDNIVDDDYVALSVNNLGQAVGASTIKGNETTHGFLWSRGTGMRDLGTLPGDRKSFAACINDRAQVVGISFGKNGPPGYLWDNGSDFNDLVGPDSPLYVLFTFAINNRGEVVGFGATESGDVHAFVARPAGGPLMGSRARSTARMSIRRR